MEFQDADKFIFVDGVPVYTTTSTLYAERLKNGTKLDELCFAQIVPSKYPVCNYFVRSEQNNWSVVDKDEKEKIENEKYCSVELSPKIHAKYSSSKKMAGLDCPKTKKRIEKEMRVKQKKKARLVGAISKQPVFIENGMANDVHGEAQLQQHKLLYCLPIYSREYEFKKIFGSTQHISQEDNFFYGDTNDIVVYQHIYKPLFFVHCGSQLGTMGFVNYACGYKNSRYFDNTNELPAHEGIYQIANHLYPEMHEIYDIVNMHKKRPNFCIFYMYKFKEDDYHDFMYEDMCAFEQQLKQARKSPLHSETISCISVSSSKYYKLKWKYSVAPPMSPEKTRDIVCDKLFLYKQYMNFEFYKISTKFHKITTEIGNSSVGHGRATGQDRTQHKYANVYHHYGW